MNYPRSIMKDYDMPLLDRVEAALARVKNRQCLMRIPVEATDMDVVVSDCGEEIKRLRVDLAQRTAERDEARRLLKSVVDLVQESMLPTQSVPDHVCGYALRPDIGVCKACEDFTDALAMIYPDEFKEAKP